MEYVASVTLFTSPSAGVCVPGTVFVAGGDVTVPLLAVATFVTDIKNVGQNEPGTREEVLGRFGDIVPKTPLGQVLSSLVMITGYSIIAVPTGIFTAELANAMRGEQLQHDCPTCSKKSHEHGAAFCSRCGNVLFPKQ